ncbi:hypothetical protein ACPW96_22810 [Micromonospora sp. DT81.3]|uniref:hypothetical protein n=1 Tax=Micromonospora sp. DT81.3 TaxID=3416523 RepID=UPI003CFBA747
MLTTAGTIPASHARGAWAAGIAPLYEAFPDAAGALVRALTFAHRAPFPVPVFITGPAGSGRTVLAQAMAELAGQLEQPAIAHMTLNGIRNAARTGSPLIVDDAGPATSNTTGSIFDQLGGEIHGTANTRLHDPTILVVNGDQEINPIVAGRAVHVTLRRRRSREHLRAAAAEPASAARRLLHSYLSQTVPAVELNTDERFGFDLALNPYPEHERRRGAALYVADEILHALHLERHSLPGTRWLEPDDQIIWAVRAAVRYTLAHGGTLASSAHSDEDWVIGRVDDTHTYLRPGELLQFIRVELNQPTLTTNALTRALARMNLIRTDAAQGGTVPIRLNGSLVRAWRIENELLA